MDSPATAYFRERLNGRKPAIGIILGSGLGDIGDRISDPVIIHYEDIPGFPPATALGHRGNFICGQLSGKCVIAMQGRYHLYEGYDLDTVTMPFRMMMAVGIETLLTTNASGALNPDYSTGDLMIIDGHIDLLSGDILNVKKSGDMYYDRGMMETIQKIAHNERIPIKCGKYVAVSGPSYETPAEHFYFRNLGGDAIGMSTVPDVELAYRNGIKVFGISIVSDAPVYIPDIKTGTMLRNDEPTDGEEVLKIAEEACNKVSKLFEQYIITLSIQQN